MKEITLDDKIEYLIKEEKFLEIYKKKFSEKINNNELNNPTILKYKIKAYKDFNKILYIPISCENILSIIMTKTEDVSWVSILCHKKQLNRSQASATNLNIPEKSIYSLKSKTSIYGAIMNAEYGINKIYKKLKII